METNLFLDLIILKKFFQNFAVFLKVIHNTTLINLLDMF